MKLSIIIPAYRSGKTITKLLTRLQKLKIKGVTREVIVVDDASPDDTYEKTKKFRGIKVIRHITNIGKGGTIRTGLARATGDILYIQDDDLEYDPLDIPKVIAPILAKKAHIAFGSRHLNGINTYSSFIYYLGGKFIDFLINLALGTRISDSLTGSKAFSRTFLKKMLPILSDGFEIEAEITAKAVKLGFSIVDVPITYRARTHKQGKNIRWHHAFGILKMLWKLSRQQNSPNTIR